MNPTPNKKDITTRKDIDLIVNEFYKLALTDEVIGYIFTDVVQLDFEEHLPTISSFWESILFGTKNVYKGNPMLKHIALDKKEKLSKVHFDRWLQLWETTIQTHFVGNKADETIQRAKSIAALMQYKIGTTNT